MFESIQNGNLKTVLLRKLRNRKGSVKYHQSLDGTHESLDVPRAKSPSLSNIKESTKNLDKLSSLLRFRQD